MLKYGTIFRDVLSDGINVVKLAINLDYMNVKVNCRLV